jgi:hypothetical protein
MAWTGYQQGAIFLMSASVSAIPPAAPKLFGSAQTSRQIGLIIPFIRILFKFFRSF